MDLPEFLRDYVRHSREVVEVRMPLDIPYRPASSNNPVLLGFYEQVAEHMDTNQSVDQPSFPEDVAVIRQLAARLKHYCGQEGHPDSCFYAAAVFFALGQLRSLLELSLQEQTDWVELFRKCLSWDEGLQSFYEGCFTDRAYETYKVSLPVPFATFQARLSDCTLSPQSRKLIENYTLILFDFMSRLGALLMSRVRQPSFKAQVNQQIICYYSYLKKLGLYLPVAMQQFVAANFK